MKNRRSLLRMMCGFGALCLHRAQSAPRRPFCRYSIEGGWSGDESQMGEFITRRAGMNDRSGVPQVVARIKEALQIHASFDILIAEQEDNAFATVANGRKILVVDVTFLDRLNRLSRTEWAAVQVIAHEVGHHIAGFLPNPHRSELSADYWSGQALQRLGSSERAATRSILTAGTEFDTSSHPNKYRRSEAIRQGWEDAARNQIDYSYCSDCR
jgi:hypothetical protein